MEKTIATIPVASDALPKKPTRALEHLPGPKGHWLVGNVKQLTPDPRPYLRSLHQELGDCFTVGFFRNQRALMMIGPEANKLLLLDPENNFSSRWGWEILHPFFGRNVLVRDFEDHRLHRKLMTHIFKADVLARYLDQMNPIVNAATKNYLGPVDVHQRTKRMALDIAIRVFAGITEKDQVDVWNADLSMVLSNVMALRIRLPGTKYWQALSARDRLRQRLATEIIKRRGNSGADMLSQLVNQRDDDGCVLSDQDVIDHMFGILFAAHDTTASSLAMIFWLLAQHPEWQKKARDECVALFESTGSDQLRYQDLNDVPTLEAVFKETLRLYAPIQLIPRRSVRNFTFQGHDIPANTWMLLAPQVTHFDETHFPDPECFNPGRFLGTASTQHRLHLSPLAKGAICVWACTLHTWKSKPYFFDSFSLDY